MKMSVQPGVGKGKRRAGGTNNCGYNISHVRGVPCNMS